MDVDTEQDRVLFIKSVAQFMVCILVIKKFEFLNEKDANRELKQTATATRMLLNKKHLEQNASSDSP